MSRKATEVDCSVAAQSIQPHILYARPATRELVRNLLHSGVQSSQRTKPFNLSMEDGQVYIDLDASMRMRDMASYQVPISASILAQREALAGPIQQRLAQARETAKKAKGEAKLAARRQVETIMGELSEAMRYLPSEIQTPTQAQLEAYIERAKSRDKGKSKAFESISETSKEKEFSVSRVGLLTQTSKMGCYSFNLPAGPMQHGFFGTCPASRFAFPMLSSKEKTRVGQSEPFSKVELKDHNWLCSGCYGLKGLYGNPSMIFLMECRKQFIEGQLALDKRSGKDDLVKFFVRSIRMGQVKSITERFFLQEMGLQEQSWSIPDPAYFRWHDVGDAWIDGWQRAIFRICEAMSEPFEHQDLGLRVPAVKFWQPTRMWALKGPLLEAANQGRIPKNLTLRPSAAHFNEAPPQIAGLASGSGSVCLQESVTPADAAKVEKITGTKLYQNGGRAWICPAYMRPEFEDGKRVGGGGGIIRQKQTKAGVKEELYNGACARAYGPDGQQPEPHGSGCRVCWDRPDLIVVYPEH